MLIIETRNNIENINFVVLKKCSWLKHEGVGGNIGKQSSQADLACDILKGGI